MFKPDKSKLISTTDFTRLLGISRTELFRLRQSDRAIPLVHAEEQTNLGNPCYYFDLESALLYADKFHKEQSRKLNKARKELNERIALAKLLRNRLLVEGLSHD